LSCTASPFFSYFPFVLALSFQSVVRKDFYREYFVKAKQLLKRQRQDTSVMASGAAAADGAGGHADQAAQLEIQIAQLDRDIDALRPPLAAVTPARAAAHPSTTPAPPPNLVAEPSPMVPAPVKRPAAELDAHEQIEKPAKIALPVARPPLGNTIASENQSAPNPAFSQKRALKKFVSPVPASQSQIFASQAGSQKKRQRTTSDDE
jgi:hypothetical protein